MNFSTSSNYHCQSPPQDNRHICNRLWCMSNSKHKTYFTLFLIIRVIMVPLLFLSLTHYPSCFVYPGELASQGDDFSPARSLRPHRLDAICLVNFWENWLENHSWAVSRSTTTSPSPILECRPYFWIVSARTQKTVVFRRRRLSVACSGAKRS